MNAPDRIKYLENSITSYNSSYRNGDSKISDEEYDKLVAELKELDPENNWFKGIEPVEVSNSRKVKLPIPMKSLNKVHNMEEFTKWVKSLGLSSVTEMVIMPKFDGVSLLIDELNHKAYSRGGSENEGQDCTEHYYKSMNSWLDTQQQFKYSYGEFIFSKTAWNTYFKDQISENTGKPYKSSRNTIAGLINSDKASELLSHAELFRYGINSATYHFDKFSTILKGLGSYNSMSLYKTMDLASISEELMAELFAKWSEYYQIDGVVIYINDLHLWDIIGRHQTTGNPLYAVAYKSPVFTETYKTEVLSVNWKVAKSGALKPTVAIETVNTGDCEMKNPTGYNAGWISDMAIAKGAEVLVTRSGGVIPKILKTLSPASDEELQCLWDTVATCPHCGEPTKWDDNYIELYCTNPDCCGRKLAKIVHFFTIVGCDGIGEETLQKIFNVGFTSITSILNIKANDILQIDGFGESIANIILNNNKRIKDIGVELPLLMHASDCFSGIGTIKAEKIIADMSPGTKDMFLNQQILSPAFIEENQGSNKTMDSFISGAGKFAEFCREVDIPVYINSIKTEVSNDKCKGMNVCFSGVRDKLLEQSIISCGGNIVSGISAKTTHLIVKDIHGNSSKINKAKSLGISILSIESFINIL